MSFQKAAIFLCLVCWAMPALANSECMAAHKAAAKLLVARASFREAIDEYRRAYQCSPEATSLFNIAANYHRLVDDSATESDARWAVDYYCRYLDRVKEVEHRDATNAAAVRGYITSLTTRFQGMTGCPAPYEATLGDRLLEIALDQLPKTCEIKKGVGDDWVTIGTPLGLVMHLFETTADCRAEHGGGCGSGLLNLPKSPPQERRAAVTWSRQVFAALVNRLDKDPAFRVRVVRRVAEFARRCGLEDKFKGRLSNFATLFDRAATIYSTMKKRGDFVGCNVRPGCNPRSDPDWGLWPGIDDCYTEVDFVRIGKWEGEAEANRTREMTKELRSTCSGCFEGCGIMDIERESREYDRKHGESPDTGSYNPHYLYWRDIWLVHFLLRRELQGVSISEMRDLLALAQRELAPTRKDGEAAK